MASELDKALRKAGYKALPLPRGKSGPTTVFAFLDGSPYVVRDAGACLPDPPIKISVDASASLVEFQREFELELKGMLGFLSAIFGLQRRSRILRQSG